MSMAHLLFERDFEAEIDAERVLARQQAASHSAEDLQAATAAGRAEGHAAGLAEGLASGWREALSGLEARRVESLGKLAVAVDDLLSDRAAHRQRLEAEMTAFVGDVADRIFPELERRLGRRRVEDEIRRIMGRAIGSPSLEIRLAPPLAEALAGELTEMGAQSGQTVNVRPDPALAPTEVRAAWLHGRSRYSFATICRSIQSLIHRTTVLSDTPDHAGQTHE